MSKPVANAGPWRFMELEQPWDSASPNREPSRGRGLETPAGEGASVRDCNVTDMRVAQREPAEIGRGRGVRRTQPTSDLSCAPAMVEVEDVGRFLSIPCVLVLLSFSACAESEGPPPAIL